MDQPRELFYGADTTMTMRTALARCRSLGARRRTLGARRHVGGRPWPSVVLALSLALSPGVSGAEAPPAPLENSADAEVTAANQLHEAGRFSDAIARYHAALSARPQLSEAWLNLGLAHLAAAQAEGYRHRARLEAAIAAFERVVARRPADRRARDLLVTSYFDGQRYATLLRMLEPEAAARPKDAELATMMARIYTQMGD